MCIIRKTLCLETCLVFQEWNSLNSGTWWFISGPRHSRLRFVPCSSTKVKYMYGDGVSSLRLLRTDSRPIISRGCERQLIATWVCILFLWGWSCPQGYSLKDWPWLTESKGEVRISCGWSELKWFQLRGTNGEYLSEDSLGRTPDDALPCEYLRVMYHVLTYIFFMILLFMLYGKQWWFIPCTVILCCMNQYCIYFVPGPPGFYPINLNPSTYSTPARPLEFNWHLDPWTKALTTRPP